MSPTGVSVSTVAATVSATETHVLKIEGYRRLKAMHGTCKCLESSRFQVAGHTWKICCYPNGDFRENAGFVSLHLELDEPGPPPPRTSSPRSRAPASLLPPHSGSFTTTYNKVGIRRRGFGRFLANQKLDWFSGYLRDDCVAARCDITVVEKSPAREEVAHQARVVEMLGLVCDCKDELCKRHHARAARRATCNAVNGGVIDMEETAAWRG
ncbi:BTB/POZ and MATH domain-containing protein 2-like [Panicum miliaceum]|uniref:BTB/POZ and MATH domain-containing protein 2-like n=1 Tax=Panicum miliaceum TaxID=4540 RepID=A0A3L6TCH6_PANMI|nr:BTB/POZ and MATH domain-containing protein 2-like [Panicum miliaceum]